MRALLLAGMLLLAAPVASARRDDLGVATCDGVVNVMVRNAQCAGTCHGVNVILASDGNCHGESGDAPEEDGDPGCVGTTVIVGGDENCHGGDGVAGRDRGRGGDGCREGLANVVVGDDNCEGGDGGTDP